MAFETAIQAAQGLLVEFLDESKKILIEDLDLNKRNATGRTKAAIRVANATPVLGQLLGPEHVQYTFEGRAPGKMPPLSKIIDWCVARNIPRNRAWIIAKRIAEAGTRLFREGAKHKNAILDATSQERIEKLGEELQKLYSTSLRSDLVDLIKK